MTPDPKPQKAIKDPKARGRKLANDSRCRVCIRNPATDGHHIIYRGKGDDVEDNIVPLCHDCHMRYHNTATGWIQLTESETKYTIQKLGRSAAEEHAKTRRLYLMPLDHTQ